MERIKEIAWSALWVVITTGLFGGIVLCLRGH